MIRKIMLCICALIVLGLLFLVFLKAKFVFWTIVGSFAVVNFVYTLSSIDEDFLKSKYNRLSVTIYTAGIFWVGYGIYRLWVAAPKIEERIASRREDKIYRAEKIAAGAGQLAIAKQSPEGGLSITMDK